MKRRLVPLLLACGLLATAYNVVVFAGLFRGPNLVGIEDDDSEERDSEEETGFAATLSDVSPREVREYLDGLATPFRNPFGFSAEGLDATTLTGASAAPTRGPLVLEGTLWSRGRRVAWIDGHPRAEGDEFAGYQVVRIRPEAVWLLRHDEELRLNVGQPLRDGTPEEALHED
ncbi:MAG: hypothetical protein MJE66_03900 [Proteobacteria bacterium]|nr:hypothetical protein [Pseudomonadota bacterium]